MGLTYPGWKTKLIDIGYPAMHRSASNPRSFDH